jgi:hypothetical protein
MWKVADTIYLRWSMHIYTLNSDELRGSQTDRTARYWTSEASEDVARIERRRADLILKHSTSIRDYVLR